MPNKRTLAKVALIGGIPGVGFVFLILVVIIAAASTVVPILGGGSGGSNFAQLAGSQCGSDQPVNVTIGAVKGFEMTPERRENAATIMGVGLRLKVARKGIIMAEAIALQESKLHNYLVPVDHDSYGVFQQRTIYWGAVSDLTNVAKASELFYKRMLKDFPNYQKASVTLDDVVVTVQDPATRMIPSYDTWVTTATQIVDGATAASSVDDPTQCGAPKAATAKMQKVLTVAYAALAKRWPYVWDAGNAKGPTKALGGCDAQAVNGCVTIGFDCSGLTLYAYAAIGIDLPHNTNAQFNDSRGSPVSITNLQPGDLVFFGTQSNVHHVGIFVRKVGDSYQMIDTPTEGQTVMTHYFYGPKDQEGDYAGARRFA